MDQLGGKFFSAEPLRCSGPVPFLWSLEHTPHDSLRANSFAQVRAAGGHRRGVPFQGGRHGVEWFVGGQALEAMDATSFATQLPAVFRPMCMMDASRHPHLILASASPRRRELLEEAGYSLSVFPPTDGAEGPPQPGEGPAELVLRLAREKAENAVRRWTGPAGILVACDTVAECEEKILGKPRDADEARQMLRQLRGRDHRVFSGLCVWPLPDGVPRVEVAVTRLRMDPLSDAEIEDYLAGGQWQGKAGAFGYQDRLGWVHVVQGSESNVVGLPLELLGQMLAALSDGPKSH